jgi:hypothetical protein
MFDAEIPDNLVKRINRQETAQPSTSVVKAKSREGKNLSHLVSATAVPFAFI